MGDNTFNVGTEVTSSLTISDFRTALGYSFFRRSDKELGIALGVHTLGYKASIEGASGGARSESVTAPLPVLSLYGQFALTDTWALSVRSDASTTVFRIDPRQQARRHLSRRSRRRLRPRPPPLALGLDVQDERSKFQARSTPRARRPSEALFREDLIRSDAIAPRCLGPGGVVVELDLDAVRVVEEQLEQRPGHWLAAARKKRPAFSM